MSGPIRCPVCRYLVPAPTGGPGHTVICSKCGNRFAAPRPPADDPLAVLRQMVEAAAQSAPPSGRTAKPLPSATPAPPTAPQPSPWGAPPAADAKGLSFWRRNLHWVLVLALVPLVVSLGTASHEKSFDERLIETIAELPRAEREEFFRGVNETMSTDDVLELLPGHRLKGALLGRSSHLHWVIAAGAAVLFLGFFMILASGTTSKPSGLLSVCLFTATVGVGFLLLVHWVGSLTRNMYMLRGGKVIVIFYLIKLIHFSATAALDPENGFLLSFVGFTLGVGLFEELVKAIPLFQDHDAASEVDCRGQFVWGLASGAGFGIAEGVLYSVDHYNGVVGLDTYLVRFLSCVALHAIWTGSVAILIYRRTRPGGPGFAEFDPGSFTFVEWIGQVLAVLAMPALLHGLYDTCLKKEMYGIAILVAVASFGYLALLLRAADRN
jgi:RsiW-degrading membrane proteinase PrsW (M82 family)